VTPLPKPFTYPVQYSVTACHDTTQKLELTGGDINRRINTAMNNSNIVTLELENKQCLPDCVFVSICNTAGPAATVEVEQEFTIDTRCDGDQLIPGNEYGSFTYDKYECLQ